MAKIVIIDDSMLARRGIMKLLKNENHEIIEADNGINGIKVIIESSPDCIILDLLMPELDGFGVLKELREKNNTTPVIVMTADIQDTVKKQVMELGAFEFLNKPPKVDDFINAVNNAIGS